MSKFPIQLEFREYRAKIPSVHIHLYSVTKKFRLQIYILYEMYAVLNETKISI